MTADTAISPTLGPRLFSFGVITDTHVNQGEDDCNSPFEVNILANRRMRHVVRDLNARDLAFVVNVGDLVHPVPAIPNLYACVWRIRNYYLKLPSWTVLFLNATYPAPRFHEGLAGTPRTSQPQSPNFWDPAVREL